MGQTKEQIARVFAMYYYADCITTEYPQKGTVNIIGDIPTDAEYYKLLLKPLSAITDEDAEVLSEVCFPDGNIYDYLHGAPTGKAIVATIKSGRQTNTFYPHARMADCFFHLIQQGYAVPLFIAPGHPDNGKTAIELGLAIDSTTLQPA